MSNEASKAGNTAGLVPPAVAKWQFVEEHARGVLDAHALREVRPALGDDDGSLAPLARCYVAAAPADPLARWYALGPVLTAGGERRRIAAALFGVASPSADAEAAALARALLEQCGLETRWLGFTSSEGGFAITFTPPLAPTRAIGQGGRDDALVERAGGAPTPLVGFTIDLGAVVASLSDADEGYLPAINVLVVPRTPAAATAALAVAQRLRAGGLRTDLDHHGAPETSLARATSAGVRLVVQVTGLGAPLELLDVDTGDGESIAFEDLDVRVAQLLD